jgi:hypothetical protein
LNGAAHFLVGFFQNGDDFTNFHFQKPPQSAKREAQSV